MNRWSLRIRTVTGTLLNHGLHKLCPGFEHPVGDKFGGLRQSNKDRRWTRIAVVLAAVFVASCTVNISEQPALAQSKKKAKFEAVSVRPSTSPYPEAWPHRSGDRLLWNCAPLALVVRYAYDISRATIEGELPLEPMYEIDARVPSSATERDIKEMLRSLLEDRFAFRTHKEMRRMPFLNLVVDSGGHRLKAAQDPPILTIHGDRLPPNHVRETVSSDGRHFAGTGVTLAQISTALADLLGQSVFDKTGIKGNFDLDVLHPKEDTPDWTLLRKAVQDNLGLRLEAGNGPVEVMVIDHVGKLSPN